MPLSAQPRKHFSVTTFILGCEAAGMKIDNKTVVFSCIFLRQIEIKLVCFSTIIGNVCFQRSDFIAPLYAIILLSP